MGGGGWFYVPKVCWFIDFNTATASSTTIYWFIDFSMRNFYCLLVMNHFIYCSHTFSNYLMNAFSYIFKVWSPAGGWWSNPTQWKRNTSIAGGVVGVIAIGIFYVSSSLERRPVPPRTRIPSQAWCKHAVEDDPSLAK